MFQKNIGAINAEDYQPATAAAADAVDPVAWNNTGLSAAIIQSGLANSKQNSESWNPSQGMGVVSATKQLLVRLNNTLSDRPQVSIVTTDKGAGTISYGTPADIEAVTADAIWIRSLSGGRFLVLYTDGSYNLKTSIIAMNSAGTAIDSIVNNGTLVALSGYRPHWYIKESGTTDKFILAYRDTSNVYCRYISVSGGTVAIGTADSEPHHLNTVDGNWSFEVMSATKAVIITDNTTAYKLMGFVVTLTEASNTVAIGAEQTVIDNAIFRSHPSRPRLAIAKRDSNYLVMVYTDCRNLSAVSSDGQIYICSIHFDGTSVLSKKYSYQAQGCKFLGNRTSMTDWLYGLTVFCPDKNTILLSGYVDIDNGAAFTDSMMFASVRIESIKRDIYRPVFHWNQSTLTGSTSNEFVLLNSKELMWVANSGNNIYLHYMNIESLERGVPNWDAWIFNSFGDRNIAECVYGGCTSGAENALTDNLLYATGAAGALVGCNRWVALVKGNISSTIYLLPVLIKKTDAGLIVGKLTDSGTSATGVSSNKGVVRGMKWDYADNLQLGVVCWYTDSSFVRLRAAIGVQDSSVNNRGLGVASWQTEVQLVQGTGVNTELSSVVAGCSYSFGSFYVLYEGATNTQLKLQAYTVTTAGVVATSGSANTVDTLGGACLATGLVEIKAGVFVASGAYNGTVNAYVVQAEPSFSVLQTALPLKTGAGTKSCAQIIKLSDTHLLAVIWDSSDAQAITSTITCKLLKFNTGTNQISIVGTERSLPVNGTTYDDYCRPTMMGIEAVDDSHVIFAHYEGFWMIKRTGDEIGAAIDYASDTRYDIGGGFAGYPQATLEPTEDGLLPIITQGNMTYYGGLSMAILNARVE